MFPFIRDGDVISVTCHADGQPGIGDVIVFLQGADGRPIVHRLIDFRPGGYILKGDQYPLSQSDGVIPKTHLIGIVSKIERKGKEVRFGLGLERFGIAWLSRLGALTPLVHMSTALYRSLKSICKKLSSSKAH